MKEVIRTMQYPIEIDVAFPERLSRLTTFFRCITLIPQLFVLYFVSIVAAVVLFISWWAILFVGRYPKSLFDFVVWYFRWSTRVNGYTYLLTDKYPPFNGDASLPAAAPTLASAPK